MRGRKSFLLLLGRRIAALRAEAKLSQQMLAERAGLTAKYVSEIERGVVNPSIDSLRVVADALELSLSRLIAQPRELELEIAALLRDGSEADRRRALAVIRALVAVK